jgi:hypothetical protein
VDMTIVVVAGVVDTTIEVVVEDPEIVVDGGVVDKTNQCNHQGTCVHCSSNVTCMWSE